MRILFEGITTITTLNTPQKLCGTNTGKCCGVIVGAQQASANSARMLVGRLSPNLYIDPTNVYGMFVPCDNVEELNLIGAATDKAHYTVYG